jgi:hypothetical protein
MINDAKFEVSSHICATFELTVQCNIRVRLTNRASDPKIPARDFGAFNFDVGVG